MPAAPETAGLPSQSDPKQNRPGKPMPERIAQILPVLHILLDYGRHLAETLEHRAVARGFSVIAQCFGTANVAAILARVCRGIMRAVALERVLLARAARGRDLVAPQPRAGVRRKPQPAPEPGAESADPSKPAAQPAALRPARRAEPEQPPDLGHLPSLEQLEAEVRRRPVGRVIADICSDLGVAPRLCAGGFWNEILQTLLCYRGSVAGFSKEMRRREVCFEKELDRQPALGWPEQKRDAIRRALGFFIGEPPVMPFPITRCVPVVATATGPP